MAMRLTRPRNTKNFKMNIDNLTEKLRKRLEQKHGEARNNRNRAGVKFFVRTKGEDDFTKLYANKDLMKEIYNIAIEDAATAEIGWVDVPYETEHQINTKILDLKIK